MNTSSIILPLKVNGTTYRVHHYNRLKQESVSVEKGSPRDLFDPETAWTFFAVSERDDRSYSITVRGRFGRCGADDRPIAVITKHPSKWGESQIVLASEAHRCSLSPDHSTPPFTHSGVATLRLVTEEELQLMQPHQTSTPNTKAERRSPQKGPSKPAQTLKESQKALISLAMRESAITRPQAIAIVLAMVEMDATSTESAKTEKAILNKAGIKSRITSVFSDRSGDAVAYRNFRKRHIINTGTRKGLYYLVLS